MPGIPAICPMSVNGAAAGVAAGWSGYVVSLAGDFGLSIPLALTGPPGVVGPHGGAEEFGVDPITSRRRAGDRGSTRIMH
jgi:hypothetical protein